MTLTFSEKAHRYRLDGKPVKSVTGIINGGIPKPGLMYWSANQAAEAASGWVLDTKAWADDELLWNLRSADPDALYEQWRKAPWEKRDQAAIRGTAVHDLAEELVHGRDVDVPDEYLPYVEGCAAFLDEWGVEPILTEKSVAHRRLWYAGRPDLIASIPDLHDGAPVLIDWKTSKSVYADTAVQTAAYARAEFYVNDDDPDAEHALPDVAGTYVAHVTTEGTALYELSPDRAHIDQMFATFEAAYQIHTRWNPRNLQEVTTS